MGKYISLDAVMAEIERLRKEDGNPYFPSETADKYYSRGVHFTCDRLVNFLDTLEVKEVDLEKELIEWHKEHFKKDGTFIGKSGFYLTNNSQMDIAKHFFELGMQVSNKSQKGE